MLTTHARFCSIQYVVASVLLYMPAGRALSAQEPVPRCGACEIRVDHIVTLRSPPSAPQPESTIMTTAVRDSRGWYYVAPMADRVSVGVYRPDGRFDRLLPVPAPSGRPPFVSEVKIRNDTLIVVDPGSRSLHLIPLHGGEPRVVDIGIRAEGVVPLRNGAFAVQYHVRTRDLIGLPLHLHTESGARVRSFGDSGRGYSQDDPYSIKRNIAPAGENRFLASSINEYRVEVWNERGELLHVFEQERTWFPAWRGYPPNLLANPAPPWLDSVRWDAEQDVIWTVVHVPSQRWRPDPSVRPEAHAVSPTLVDRNRVFDTILEVLDARSGELITTRRIYSHISGYLNGGSNLYVTSTADSAGVQQIEVKSLRLVQP